MGASPIKYSSEELAFIEHRQKMLRSELHRLFVEAFQRHDVTHGNIQNLLSRKGWTSDQPHYQVGHTPATKGMKMPFSETRAAALMLKRREFRTNDVVVREKKSREGYAEVVIISTGPDGRSVRRHTSKHRILWENLYGPIPKGFCLKCKGEKSNPDPSNWEMIPVALLPRLNANSGRNYDAASAELKPTILAVTKLEYSLQQKAKGSR